VNAKYLAGLLGFFPSAINEGLSWCEVCWHLAVIAVGRDDEDDAMTFC
jgi:hypothetical protein